MQDVGSDSGDSSGYLRIPSSWHSAVDACTVVGYIEEGAAPLKIPCWSGLHAMNASKIKLALNIWWFYNGGFAWQVIWPALIMVIVDSPSPSKTTNPSNQNLVSAENIRYSKKCWQWACSASTVQNQQWLWSQEIARGWDQSSLGQLDPELGSFSQHASLHLSELSEETR